MSRRYRYTEEEIEFVRRIATGRYNDEIADLFNGKFGTNVAASHIRSLKANHKIKSDVPRRKVHEDDGLFTKEQKEFIKENVKGLLNQELTDLINEEFGLSVTVKQMKNWKKNHDLSSGLKGSEGMDPPNKGTKGKHNVGGNRTSFKPGQQPLNYRQIGSERIDRDGYTLVKVRDDGPSHKRWRHKHVLLWEQTNGPVPKGHAVLFADQDKQNIKIENLILVSRKQLARLNQNHLLSTNPDATRTGIILADIFSKIGERKKSM